ncbi:oxidoreductase [Dunaliella salina]|uniref:Oxidoreductase n=1 Tax=Dunaliella salina TaxID=3046 RepID=A0ABQ7H5R2_DUNSA|nr:oxidoreductase [Dunaliella salina]|eukprot:KAF5842195.1 oxidoreductase [Dunaliella salina]
MTGTAAVITGASRGIGLALTRARLSRSRQELHLGHEGSRLEKLFAVCRNPSSELLGLAASTPRVQIVQGSLTSATGPADLATAIRQGCAADGLMLSELYNIAGSACAPFFCHMDCLYVSICLILREPKLGVEPERRLEDMANLDGMLNTFAINSFAPIRLIGALAPQFCSHDQMVRVASWSARVGSITDNRLGGWYSYRASKAAQNSFTKSAAIELQRRKQRKGGAAVVAVHPGTVDTALSAPFQRNVKHEILRPEASAQMLMDLILHLQLEDNGKFFAYDGTEIPW